MELKVVKKDEKGTVFEIKGETIGFAHLLKDELWKDSNVKEAAAIKEHPYLSEPKVFVNVSRGSPETTLEKASEGVLKEVQEFGDKFKTAVKK
jgi:DNA-directed RNA polymerase subunit L